MEKRGRLSGSRQRNCKSAGLQAELCLLQERQLLKRSRLLCLTVVACKSRAWQVSKYIVSKLIRNSMCRANSSYTSAYCCASQTTEEEAGVGKVGRR